MASAARDQRLERFRELNEDAPLLVLPGAWDFVSARMFASEGFPALGTTSSGISWTIGRSSGWDSFLAASARIVGAVDVPVSLDIEEGFSGTPEGVARHVRQAIEIGACGVNLEDGLADGRLGDASLLVDKLQAAREVCVATSHPLFINARTDVFLGGFDDLSEAIRRGRLYAEAGADMFFAPGIAAKDDIATLVREVPIAVNVYALPGVPSVDELDEMGVGRLSVGCGVLQSALADARRVARGLAASGSYGFADDWISFDEAESLCID